ncbi:hypothetical protein EZV62_027963 [Acer yangbiense]|uniref:Uncharacterized protein n=1 Tax=Acer yangbiense TaxID=1000413 RepID=A0A5C7GPI5_9ROSI|nr:hypothetical protein EZV62_027963 [Acer yangbiense]
MEDYNLILSISGKNHLKIRKNQVCSLVLRFLASAVHILPLAWADFGHGVHILPLAWADCGLSRAKFSSLGWCVSSREAVLVWSCLMFRMLSGSSNRWVVVRLVRSSSDVRNSCVSGGRMAWVCKLLAQRNEFCGRGVITTSIRQSYYAFVNRHERLPHSSWILIVEWLYNVHASVGVVKECYLVDPASSHMLVSKIKPCMFVAVKKLVVGPWVGSTGPPRGVHRSARPFCRRCAPGLNWPGRASGAVTLKKLECSKQAYALDTLAWDNIIGFRSYSVGLRDRSND